MTDTNLIYLYQDNKDDILKKYNINPINLYSYDKDINFNLSSKIIGGVNVNDNDIDISRLFSSSHIRNISPIEATKINHFINHFFHFFNHRPSSRTKIGFIYSFQFNSISYFIEFSIKQNDKLIISVNLNPDFSNELIHISCFFNSFIHITFFLLPNIDYIIYIILIKIIILMIFSLLFSIVMIKSLIISLIFLSLFGILIGY